MSRKLPEAELSAEIERAAYRERIRVFLVCREVGSALVRDSLKEGVKHTAIINLASRIAQHANNVLTRARDKYRPHLHCQEGCFYCCCKPGVLTSIPELLHILDYVQTTFDAVAISELNDRARRYVRQVAGRNFNNPTNESIPCPFLVGGRC